MRSLKLVGLVALVLLSARSASASTDINGLFDARSHGMGGTGVAFIDSAGGLAINPALLDQVKKLTISADVFGLATQAQVPYSVYHQNPNGTYYKNYETFRSKPNIGALPFLGGAIRLHKRLVFGAGVYPLFPQGVRSKYQPAPDQYPNLYATNKVTNVQFEAGNALAVRIFDNLAFAFMWRITYSQSNVTSPVASGGPPAGVTLDTRNADNPSVVDIHQSINGMNFRGIQLGLLYKPLPNLRLGFTYRNRVNVDASGTTKTTIGGMNYSLPTKTTTSSPNAIRAGFALSLMNNKLLLAGDFKYDFYKAAYKNVTQRVTQPGSDEPMTVVQPVNWYNSWVVEVGGEYKALDWLAVRTGYTILKSATNGAYAQAFFAPPGYSHLIMTGLGFKLSQHFDLDVAAGALILQSMVKVATDYNQGIGKYTNKGAEFSLSSSYRL